MLLLTFVFYYAFINCLTIVFDVVYMIQVKVLLRWRLKLIVMTSLNVHMKDTLTNCIHVLILRNVLIATDLWVFIWMFTALSGTAIQTWKF